MSTFAHLDSTIPKEARPFGSKAHLEWRQKQRSEGKMNAPVRRHSKSHSWSCKCSDCWTPEVVSAIKEFAHDCDQCSGRRTILVNLAKNEWKPCPSCSPTIL